MKLPFPSPARLVAFALALVSTPALARQNGITTAGCDGCHGSANTSDSSLTPSPADFEPGDSVTFTLTVRAAGSKAAGVFVPAPVSGTLGTLAGEGLTLSPAGLTHSAPKTMQNGEASFRFTWVAPAERGAVDFTIYSLGADGNSRSSGDAAGRSRFDFVYGCTGQTFYYDADGDGFGGDRLEPALGCSGEPPVGYSERDDDCDESYDSIHPDAEERCNQKDDDCDGAVDEDSTPIELFPDLDGDGYHDFNGDSVLGCVPLAGYAAEGNDCGPNDPARHPGATEVCNLFDDNCDGRVDERIRPQCGEGWCRRDSINCDPESCTPGAPTVEKCNLLDDDCDGEVDEGEICAGGAACLGGSCLALEGVAGNGGGGTIAGSGGSNGGSGGSNGGRAASPQGGSPSSGGIPPSSSTGGRSGGAPSAGATNPPSASPSSKKSSGCSATRAPGGASVPLAGLMLLGWLLQRRRCR